MRRVQRQPPPSESYSRQRLRALERAARKENLTKPQRHTADRAIKQRKERERGED